MKPCLLISCLLLAGRCLAQLATPQRVAAPVREVTLFAKGAAELRHEARPTLPAGPVVVRLTGLAADIDATTLQVEVGRGAELLSAELVPSDQPAAVDSAARAHLAYRRARAEYDALEQERFMLVANSHVPGTTAATWDAAVGRVAAAFHDRIRDVLMRQSAASEQLERLRALDATLNRQEQGNQQVTARDALLRLQIAVAGPVALTVRYRAVNPRTGWGPTLALRAASLTAPLRAVSTAQVTNSTGVSWTNVRLTLVNSSSSESVERPNLQPWTIRALLDADGNRRLERANDDDDAVGEGRLDGFATKGSSAGSATAGGAIDSLRVVSPLSDRFRVAGRVTVPVGVAMPVPIETLELPMRAEYYVVPKLDPKVLLIGKVTGWQALRAPAAQAQVFLAGNYVGTTDMNLRAFNDSLEVALGADPLIVVSRTKRADRNSRSLLGSTQRTTLGYEINLRNDRPGPIRVRVADQIPVPLDRDITVTPTEISGATLDAESGRLTWIVNLKAGESRRLSFAFTVEAPAGKTLNLEYRERMTKSPKFR